MAERGGVLEIGARGADVDAEMAAKLPGLRAGSAVEVWVRDEGCGMDAETRARIYEPFFSTKYGEGTGLGLPVVHGIVRAHGGGITVDTEPGKGTLFRVYLPAAPVVAAHPPPKPVAPPTPGRHVLYVDDDEDLVELAEIAFRRVGYRVTACSRARLALDVFRKDPGVFDLVVTDQRMPEMLGEDLIPALHAVRPDVPVVLMSGDVSPADEARIRARGAEAVVEKPRTMDALVRLCHDVLSRREAVADA
jgi:CheY-like chemotaxis protein